MCGKLGNLGGTLSWVVLYVAVVGGVFVVFLGLERVEKLGSMVGCCVSVV